MTSFLMPWNFSFKTKGKWKEETKDVPPTNTKTALLSVVVNTDNSKMKNMVYS